MATSGAPTADRRRWWPTVHCDHSTRGRDSNPFDLKSSWVAPLNGDKGAVVTFIGIKADNTLVRTNFVLDDRKVWRRYNFPATFTNLQYAMWVQGDCGVYPVHMFDSVRVSPTSANRKVENDEDD